MQVLLMNRTDVGGGAAIAAYRLHCALRQAGVESRMWVEKAAKGDWTVEGPKTKWGKAVPLWREKFGQEICRLLKTENKIVHSVNWLRSGWPKQINRSAADVVNLHWVNGEMLSIRDVNRITKPLVWTLHDMWAFCGAEHVTEDFRWRDGYQRDNRPAYEGRWDLNRWTWQRKRRHWTRPFQIVTPSHWLAEQARASVLFRDWPIEVIPNPLDMQLWQPVEKPLARQLLQLPQDRRIVLFGAYSGTGSRNKGFDLLSDALRQLSQTERLSDVQLVVLGQAAPQQPVDLGFPIRFLGRLHDDVTLRLLYSSADVTVIPSRIENLPSTAVESLACGTPAVGFNNHGLRDIVTHQRTGYLAQAFEASDLARGIEWALNQGTDSSLSEACRALAVAKFDNRVVAEQYHRLYRRVSGQ